ncbi:MAG: hypothetical protein ABR509_08810, partial [Candidatus Limnocylindria bacterium]
QFSAYRTPRGMYRRLEEAWYVRADGSGRLDPVRLTRLDAPRSPSLTGAQRLPGPPLLATDGGRSGRPFLHDDAAHDCLAERFEMSPADWAADVARRQAFLGELAERGTCDVVSVALAVQDYPELPAHPGGASIE